MYSRKSIRYYYKAYMKTKISCMHEVSFSDTTYIAR